MKVFYLLVFFCLFSADAQRRSVKSELLSENEPPPKSARRGRARFTATSETPQIEEQKRSDPISRRLVSRRKPEIHTEATPVRKGYEVDEIVDETPIETFRKYKVKTLTETKYEAQNAPPSNTLFQPSTTENVDEFLKSIGQGISDTTSSSVASSPSLPTSLEPLSSDSTSSEITRIDNEISRTQPETTTPLTTKTTKRSNSRSRVQNAGNAPTAAPRVRSRSRSRQPEEPSANSAPAAARAIQRGPRRRPDAAHVEPRPKGSVASAETVEAPSPRPRGFEARTRAPPTIASAETVEQPRARTIESRRRPQTIVSAETVEQPSRSRVESRRRGPSVIAAAEHAELPSRSRSGRRIATVSRTADESKPEKITIDLADSRAASSRKSVETATARSRSRSRVTPPIIDEQKLEVLPLFERESKTVKPVRKLVSRRRNLNSAEEVETSATENDVKLAEKPVRQSVVVETRTESTVRRRKVNVKNVGRVTKATTTVKPTTQATRPTTQATKSTTQATKPTTQSTVRTTKATARTGKPTVQISKPTLKTSKPVIKESVISEITEVTSKRTVTRSKSGARNKVEEPKFVQRGSKKSEVDLTNVKKKASLTSSEEEIDDTDNYPEPFKALIQAKKQKKESRPPQRLVTSAPTVTKSTEKVVSSSPSTTSTQVISTEAPRQLEDSENELDPLRSRPTRRRFSSTTEKATRATRKGKYARSTTAAPREHRFHAKFNTEPEVTSGPVKSSTASPSKPPRGLYSSRKTKESYTKSKSAAAQIPAPKKSSRYSSRYRSDASSRGAIRTSTSAPAYLPTIPTITPPTTAEYVWPEEENIEYSWSFSRLN